MGRFRVTPVPDDLAEALALRAERLGGFGARLLFFETVPSTNDEADRLAADGLPHGTVVVADAQSSGRGRMGRTWFSPPGAGLYVSVILRPAGLGPAGGPAAAPAGVTPASSVSMAAGVALAEAIRRACGLPVSIKWPNDLVVDGRKLCGILAEASASADSLQHVILGYGINIRPAAYPPDLAARATSLETELGRPVDRGAVLAESLASLAEWLPPGPGGDAEGARPGRTGPGGTGFDRMLARWRELSPSSAGSRVEVLQPGGGVAGATTAGIAADGALLVQVGGTVQRVIAGEVRWL